MNVAWQLHVSFHKTSIQENPSRKMKIREISKISPRVSSTEGMIFFFLFCFVLSATLTTLLSIQLKELGLFPALSLFIQGFFNIDMNIKVASLLFFFFLISFFFPFPLNRIFFYFTFLILFF